MKERLEAGDQTVPDSEVAVTVGQAAKVSAPAMMPLMSRGTIVLLVLGAFGASIAYLVPMVFSLALRVDQISPGSTAALGYIIGAGSIFTLVTSPLSGILSDRTRSRLGKRRPFIIGGMLLGLSSIPFMAYAPNMIVLGIGWIIANIGWGTAAGGFGNFQADQLPPSQRGKVAGLIGMVNQVAPIAGIVLVGNVTGSPLWLIMLPMVVGTPLVISFILLANDPDSRGLVFANRLTFGSVMRSFWFRPSQFPDFAWNWVGRFAFFAGISLTMAYSTFFTAHRLGIAVQDIAPMIAILSGIGMAASSVGAVFGGAWSDRLQRRRPFVLAAVLIFVCGSVTNAFAPSLPFLIAGSVLSSSSVALFLAVNQAMVLEILPHRETQAGRFMAITAFSQKVPNSLAPFVAPLILAAGSAAGTNYTLLYLITGFCVLVGGLIITVKVKSVA